MNGLRIGCAMTGSFCTFHAVFEAYRALRTTGAELIPILSHHAGGLNTRFGTAAQMRATLTEICGRAPIDTIEDAEPIGPKKCLDLLIVAPCTGNTLGKMACGINDTPVTMAVKSQLRNQRPVLLAIATNDGLGMSARNIGTLLTCRGFYFVPFAQDDPVGKPCSLIADMTRITEAARAALAGRQLPPHG